MVVSTVDLLDVRAVEEIVNAGDVDIISGGQSKAAFASSSPSDQLESIILNPQRILLLVA